MKLSAAIAALVGLTEKLNAKLDKITSPANPPPKANDDDPDDEECPDCDGTGKCEACGGTGKMESGKKACTHTHAVAEATKALGDATAKLESHAATIKDLNAKLETAQNQVNTLSAENAKLKEEVKKGKTATTAAIASTGIPADKLPEATAEAPAGGNMWERYAKMCETRPLEAARFYNDNAEAILADRNKAQK